MRSMPLWLTPMVYMATSVAAGTILPRLEQAYLGAYTHHMSVGAALAFFSAVSSGMIALTGIVFAIAFVTVQFSAVAYSPRLVIMFVNNPALYHTLGIFFATFTYSLVALAWTDRGGSGIVPLFSTMLVVVLLVVSMLAFSLLIRSLDILQIHNVLRVIGAQGRAVIRAMFPRIADNASAGGQDETETAVALGAQTQTLSYSGEPRVIARFDIDALVRLAQGAGAVVVIECGVGETLVEDTMLLRVHGAAQSLPERALMRAVHLSTSRTFEQDPKYAIRLLVDIAIRALSPAVNDPTTAVQALDQIEDLLRRLGRRRLDTGRARDAGGALRLIFPTPTWQDYLALSFDEIRQFGATSVQVMRRLRSVLVGLSEAVATEARREAVRRYIDHLNLSVGRSAFDDQDQVVALEEDRQGLGLSRKRRDA
ncbi:DUF2254 domain-containing protein [Limobrevibacterium gyesilva]|uniref:DUF2254 domain-containing protein n=1 Tax=Limobrevibacterium gyesilva TaxID=2991712 RepID=A0AA42CJM6_9PROT|nr:DUF2254 domain-containing protein [Limobrevibacterium gyesilva]MCW3477020.1 DUF2254 domain-containing protein [Limobrevibacterium gyesilva]